MYSPAFFGLSCHWKAACMRAVHLPKYENVRLLGARGRSVVTLSPKIFGEPQYGLKKSKSGVAGSTPGNARTPNFV